jgi:hypothetical protein
MNKARHSKDYGIKNKSNGGHIMKKVVVFIVTLALMTGFNLAFAAKAKDDSKPITGITDKSNEAKKMNVIKVEPAKIKLEATKKPESKVPANKNMILPTGNFLSSRVPEDGLTEKGKEAVAVAPKWLRVDLADTFKRLDTPARQDIWAQLIIDNATEKYEDELVFTIAHSSVWYLKQAFASPQAYLENAQMLYVVDADVSYADIIDHGTPGVDDDYYSTIKYWTLDIDGNKVQREWGPELYYWYVVHPKLSDDYPDIGASGQFWRGYLYNDVEGQHSYTTSACLRTPNAITENELNNWNYSSYGYFPGKNTFATPKIVAKDTGEAVLVNYHSGYGGVIATMMPVDKGENTTQQKLLENMVYTGKGESTMATMLPNPNAKARFAIFKDNDPWGKKTIENAINKFGNPYDVYTSANMATFELSPQCKKIIIPSDQPRAFYEALAANAGRFNDWINNYNVFEFHGACSPENDWSDLTMPGGITSVSQSENMINSVEIRKLPTLKDVLKLADVVWDAKASVSLPIRTFDQGDNALDIVSNWACWNMAFNAHPTVRPNQPEPLAFNHCGNCGEIQDIIAAAGRVALVPMSCTDGFVEDHVWNEFYDEGWFFLNNDWFGNSSAIGYPGGGQDKDYGGGKNISVMRRNRGDTFNENITAAYTKNCTLEVTIKDKNGYPVDGANVRIYTEWYYDSAQFVTPIEYSTDSNGFTSFVLGDARNYYVRVESTVGNYPSNNSSDMTKVIDTSVPDQVYTWDCNLSSEIARPDGEKITDIPHYTLNSLAIDFTATQEIIYGSSSGKGYSQSNDTGEIDYIICDSQNLAKYLNGEHFKALDFIEDVDQVTTTLQSVDITEQYYIVFSNYKHVRNADVISLNVKLNQDIGPTTNTLDSFSTELRVHPGEIILVALNNKAPYVLGAGFFSTDISKSQGGTLDFRALVLDPDGYNDIEKVELVIDGAQTGTYFRDDGIKGDETAGDSIFSYNKIYFPNQMDKGLYKNYGVVAIDRMGNKSTVWPQLHVEADGAMNLPVSEDVQDKLEGFYESMMQSGSPVILLGGYGITSLSASKGGLMTMYAYMQPNGNDPYTVEMMYDGTPLGIYLVDTGKNGDLAKGDGLYTFSMNFGSFPAGDYIIELQASDKQGNKSITYPYFEVTE